MDKPDPGGSAWKMASVVSLIGVDFAVCTMAGFYAGSWLGNWLGSRGIGVGMGVLAGMGAGVFGAVVIIRRIMRESDE
jgi:ATP synthase protein I